MLVFTAICLKSCEKNTCDYDLKPGHYKVEIVGSRGANTINHAGGNPSMFTGNIKIIGNRKAKSHAGFQQGGSGIKGFGVAGGDYSAFYLDDELYAMVGGGGGALSTKDGLPAGGIGYVYDSNLQKVYKNGVPLQHYGGHAEYGSGGGNGYFGGEGGKQSHPQGQGGSSYVKPDSFTYTEFFDGATIANSYTQIHNYGHVTIIPLQYCSENCTSCLFGKDYCEKCDAGNHLFIKPGKQRYCVDSCDRTDVPSFEAEDGSCQSCWPGCKKCTSMSQCLECESGYHLTQRGTAIFCSAKPNDPIYVPPEFTSTTELGTDINNETTIKTNNSSLTLETQSSTEPTSNDLTEITTTTIEESANEKGISNIRADGINNQNRGNGDSKARKGFKWWIVVAVFACIVLIVIIMVFIIYRKPKGDESIEMADEKIADTNAFTTTSVTVENPMYITSNDAEEDPFKDDFDDDNEPSDVFQPQEALNGNNP